MIGWVVDSMAWLFVKQSYLSKYISLLCFLKTNFILLDWFYVVFLWLITLFSLFFNQKNKEITYVPVEYPTGQND